MSDRTELTFEELLDAMCERGLSADELARLESLVGADASRRAAVAEMLQLDAILRFESTQRTPAAVSPSQPASDVIVEAPSRLRLAPVVYAAAAALLLAAAAFAVYLVAGSTDPTDAPSGEDFGAPIATLIDASRPVFVNDNVANPGSEYRAGAYGIEAGHAEFLLSNRVSVTLAGKTRLRMHTPMRATLENGSLICEVPTGAHGFTVELSDRVRVVDLGTSFRVDTDASDRAIVRVTEGAVRIDLTALDGSERSYLLTAGELARLAIADGEATTLTMANADDMRTIGPGMGVADATESDTPGGDRLNVDRRATRLAAGTYRVSDWVIGVADHTQGGAEGVVTPMLLVGAPGEYRTVWVGDAFNPDDDGVQTVIASGSFTLAEPADVYAGFFTTHGAAAIVAHSSRGSTDHDVSFVVPSGPGAVVDGFSNSQLNRSYVFGINVIAEPARAGEAPNAQPQTQR